MFLIHPMPRISGKSRRLNCAMITFSPIIRKITDGHLLEQQHYSSLLLNINIVCAQPTSVHKMYLE